MLHEAIFNLSRSYPVTCTYDDVVCSSDKPEIPIVILAGQVSCETPVANIYGTVLARLGTAPLITNTMLGLAVPPATMILILMLGTLILGWPLESPAIVLMFVPIFLTVVTELGFNLVWFCTLAAVKLQTAFLSPPVAMAAYYLKGVASDWSLTKIYRGMMEFMILQCIGLMIVVFFLEVALCLPKLIIR